MKSFFGVLFCFVTAMGMGASNAVFQSHELSAEQQRIANQQNAWAEAHPSSTHRDFYVERPFAEFEQVGYLVLDDTFFAEAPTIKSQMVRNLPEGVTAVITSRYPANAASWFGQYISKDRLIVVPVNGTNIWARDHSPLPVFLDSSSASRFAGVRTTHYIGGVTNLPISQWLKFTLLQSDFAYPGGNFLTDTKGNCFGVAGARYLPPEENMKQLYGCKNLTRLSQVHGIGDVDEVVKFISDTVAITDSSEYVPLLQERGYTTYLMPRPTGLHYGTYINSVPINGKIFVPNFSVDTDATANALYQQLGYEVIPLPSRNLSEGSKGSLHCMSMTYPPMPRKELDSILGISSSAR